MRRRSPNNGNLPLCQGPFAEIKVCNACQQDCVWSTWSAWSTCSSPCGSGTTIRGRGVLIPSAYGGSMCFGNTNQILPCQMADCSSACVWTQWSPYTPCSHMCGGGTMTRYITNTRNTSMSDAEFASLGESCNTIATETATCNSASCNSCVWGDWGQWSPCSVSCGEGQRTRDSAPAQGTLDGTPCDNYLINSRQYGVCNLPSCPGSGTMNTHLLDTSLVIVIAVVSVIIFAALLTGVLLVLRFTKNPIKRWVQKKSSSEPGRA